MPRSDVAQPASRCRPASVMTDMNKRGKWRLIPYKADRLGGTMIGAGAVSDAPEVVLPLGAKGWHGVYVGFWNPTWAYSEGTTINLKLTDDPCFTTITDQSPGTGYTGTQLTEAFWKHVDLTGRDLWGPPGDGAAVMRAIKDRFDPQGLLNPGRFVY